MKLVTKGKEREHGTYTGAQQHTYRGESLCDPCREARNAYMRDWRDRNGHRDARRNSGVRSKVLVSLRRDHPDLYGRLYRAAAHEWDRDHPEVDS